MENKNISGETKKLTLVVIFLSIFVFLVFGLGH
jgi:hypothetical protein